MKATILPVAHKASSSRAFWLLISAGVALVIRVLVVLFYQPVTYSDTGSYRRLANAVLQGFTNYDGTRTPGYPIFLALTGTDQHAWIAQLFLGFITTLLLFYLGWKLTDRPWFGGLIALVHTLNLGQLFFESNLLTESLTTFLVVLSVTGLLAWLLYPKVRSVWFAFLLGVVSSTTLLVRPLFIYLPILILVFIGLELRLTKYATPRLNEMTEAAHEAPYRYHPWRFGFTFLVPVVLLLGGWLTFIHAQFNEWSLTTMTGYHLVQHTGNFFEYVPDEYASIRDTYIKYRNQHIAQFGNQTNTIWDAIPEMSKVSGYSFYGLSRVLTSISIQLILHHPLLFAQSALSGWWMFWRVPVYWSADALQLPSLAGIIKFAVLLERGALFVVNLIFIIGSIYFIVIETIPTLRGKSSLLRPRMSNPTQYIFLWFLLTNIWIASILQTLLDHGDNPRFLVPLQPLVVLWVCVFIIQSVKNKQIQPATIHQS